MLKKAKILREMGELSGALQIVDELIEIADREGNEKIGIDALLTKIYCLWQLYDNEAGLELSFQVEKKLKSIDQDSFKKQQYGNLLHLQGNLYGSIGNYSKAIAMHTESLEIFRGLDDKRKIALMLNNLGFITSLVGDTTKAENLLTQALELAQELGNLQDISRTLNNLGILHFQKGDYEQSLEFLEKGLGLQEKINNPIEISYSYLELIKVCLVQNKRDQALQYYGKLNLLGQEHDHDMIKLRIKLCHAILLKGEKRYRSKVEAAFIFEEILNEKVLHQMYSLAALKHLAEIKFEELEHFENERILEEIEDIVLQLQAAGRRQNSVLVSSEADLLLSKLCLIRGEIQKSKDLLNTAQNSAEKHGLHHLAMNISNLHDKLLEQLSYWDAVSSGKDGNYGERINQAEIYSFLRNLQYNKLRIERIGKEKPTMFMVLGEGGVIKSSIKFEENENLHEHLIGSFISAVSSFFTDVFPTGSEIERIKSSEYTLLLKAHNGFTYCYICQGQSYYAIHKLQEVVDKISRLEEYQLLLKKWKETKNIEVPISTDVRSLITSILLKEDSN